MMTIKDLRLRNFKTDASGKVVSATTKDVEIARAIPFKDFLESQPYWTNSKIVSQTAHEVLNDVLGIALAEYPTLNPWAETYVYRDKVDIHGYVDTYKENSPYPVLHPDLTIDKLAFSRVISRLHICGDENYNLTVALKWEPKEMQIAIGTNVRICNNFNIFGSYSGNALLKTNRSLTYENIRHELISRMKGLEEHFGHTVEHIQNLIAMPLNSRQVRFILGDLMTAYDLNKPVINYTDIHEISKKVAQNEKDGQPVSTLWQLLNIGTDVLRFENNGGDTSFENIQSWNEYCDGILSISTAKRNGTETATITAGTGTEQG